MGKKKFNILGVLYGKQRADRMTLFCNLPPSSLTLFATQMTFFVGLCV